MLFIYFISISAFYITYHHHYYYEDLQRCAKASSHYILNLRISFEQQVLIELQEYLANMANTPYDYQTTAQIFMSDVIREVNFELESYGIHIRPDYGQLIMENFPFEFNKAACSDENAVMERTEVAHEYFNTMSVHGIGNRLLIYFCDKVFSGQTLLSYIAKVKECGHILGVMYHDPENMKVTLKDEIVKMFTGGNRSDEITPTHFNTMLCSYVKTCVSEIGNLIGEHVSNMRNIKDVSGVNFLLPVDSRTRMHSVFDDVAYAGPFHGNKRLYPIDNYFHTDNNFLNLHCN